MIVRTMKDVRIGIEELFACSYNTGCRASITSVINEGLCACTIRIKFHRIIELETMKKRVKFNKNDVLYWPTKEKVK